MENTAFNKFGTATKDIIGWDDPIKDDGQNHSYVTLPAGIYDFTVTGFERKYYSGGAGKDPCNYAQLNLDIHGGELGEGRCRTSLFLKDTVMWKVATFFVSLGLLKQGDELKKMPWEKIIGKSGKAEFEVREYQDKSYEKKTCNDVKRFVAPSPETPKAAAKKKVF